MNVYALSLHTTRTQTRTNIHTHTHPTPQIMREAGRREPLERDFFGKFEKSARTLSDCRVREGRGLGDGRERVGCLLVLLQ
jgi:hypothetical protein